MFEADNNDLSVPTGRRAAQEFPEIWCGRSVPALQLRQNHLCIFARITNVSHGYFTSV
jgi:hypothetical protein